MGSKGILLKYWHIFDEKYLWDQRVRADDRDGCCEPSYCLENPAYMFDKYSKNREQDIWQIFDEKYLWDQRVRADDRDWLL